MEQPNQYEIAAMDYAGGQGGAYLDSLRKTDMAMMTADEWQTFVAAICGGYVSHLLRARHEVVLAADKITSDEVPF